MLEIPIINRSAFALPTYATEGAAGMDLRANTTEEVNIAPGERVLIPTGFFIALPQGYEAQLRMRSGLALRKGLMLPNAPATIDSDYRGEIKIILANISNEVQVIAPGERIAQMVVAKHATIKWQTVNALPSTLRGKGGFGSTGIE